MLESTNEEKIEKETGQRWAGYNSRMRSMFTERNRFPVDSPERQAAAQSILSLWLREGD